jgi:hypothetical protein
MANHSKRVPDVMFSNADADADGLLTAAKTMTDNDKPDFGVRVTKFLESWRGKQWTVGQWEGPSDVHLAGILPCFVRR